MVTSTTVNTGWVAYGAIPGPPGRAPLTAGGARHILPADPDAQAYHLSVHTDGDGHLACVVILDGYAAVGSGDSACTARLVADGHGGWRAGR